MVTLEFSVLYSRVDKYSHPFNVFAYINWKIKVIENAKITASIEWLNLKSLRNDVKKVCQT